jgi:ribose transport system substrate-binding protein
MHHEYDSTGKPSRRRFLRLVTLGVGGIVLAACGATAPAAGDGTAATAAPAGGAAPATAAPAAGGAAASGFDPTACYRPTAGITKTVKVDAKTGPYVIALSNSYIGNVWRTQMIKMAKAFTELPDVKPSIKQFLVNSSGNDAAQQISQIENMIAAGAQAIIINAASPTALDPVVKKAQQAGIVVLAFDNIVETPGVVIVNEDQVEFGSKMAEWLVQKMGGKGNVLMVNGVAGTSVDADRSKGAKDVFAKNSGIKVIAEVNGEWDPGKAQQVTSTALSSYPDINGVWCQGGTDGVVRAFQQAGKPLVPVAGEAENGFRKQLLQLKDQGLSGISIGQSPGMVAVCIRAAIDLLGGKELPLSISIPLPSATSDELKDGVNVFTNLPDNFFTPIQIAPCGVNLTVDQINAQQV